MKPTGNVDSVAPSHVLAELFRTEAGAKLQMTTKKLSFDLTEFAGKNIRVRFALVDNQGFFHAGVDGIVIE